MRASLIAIVVAAGATVATVNAYAQDVQGRTIAFDDARLGMSLAEWEALAYPGRKSDLASPVCSGAPQSTRAGPTFTAAARITTAAVVCGYATPVAGVPFAASVALDRSFLVNDPRYNFVDGRLSRIEFQSSIDAFNNLCARFEAVYGPASQTLRDSIPTREGFDWPRVRKVWRLPAGTIEIVDPVSSNPTRLAVSLVAR